MAISRFRTPPDQRYFEDYEVGATYELGTVSVSEEEIIAFAREYDPQVYHVDPEAAKAHYFGGIIASGWHTGCLMMRLYVESYLSSVAALGSPGVDKLRWPRPTRPGDTLALQVTVQSARRSQSKPDRGVVVSYSEFRNQHGEPTMTMLATNLFLCRAPVRTA